MKAFSRVVSKILMLVLLCCFFQQTHAAVSDKKIALHYTFKKLDSTSLLITVSFTGNAKGSTVLHLPSEWAGQQNLHKAVKNLMPLTPHATIDTTNKADEYLIKYGNHDQITFSYVLQKVWKGKLTYPNYFRPVITKDLFYFEGYSGLVYPDFDLEKKIDCKISYEKFSETDFKGNSFFAGKNEHVFTSNLDQLLNSFYCAGNFRAKETLIGKNKIVMAIAGKFTFSDEEVFATIPKIIDEERRFWGQKNEPYFFTLLMPTADQNNIGGTAHQQSFYIFQSPNLNLNNGLTKLIAHEYFHNWLGQRLKMPVPDELYKWFSEGFTDYYAFKLLYKTKIFSREEFINEINGQLKAYYLSPYFNLPNTELVGKYWTNAAYTKLSYARGLAIALMLDHHIFQTNKKSLDELMLALYPAHKKEAVFSNEKFEELVVKFAGKDVLAAIKQANAGENALLNENIAAITGFNVKQLVVDKRFDLGFALEESIKAGKIIGLKANSSAAAAGLEENMPITGKFSIWNNQVDKPARVAVIKNGVETWVEYLPIEAVRIEIPQLY